MSLVSEKSLTRDHPEDMAYFCEAGNHSYTHRASALQQMRAHVEWHEYAEADRTSRECVLHEPDPESCASQSRIREAFAATDVRYGLYKYLSPSDIQNVDKVIANFAPDPNTIRNNGLDPHLLKDIFPMEQYDKVRSLMSEGMGFTLVGEGIHDLLERALDPKAWDRKKSGKKIHLLLLVTPSKEEYLPSHTIRQSTLATQDRLVEQQNYVRVNDCYKHANSRQERDVFVDTKELLAKIQIPGKWYDYTRHEDLGFATQAAKDLVRSLHEASEANRRIFSHQSLINQRGNLLKVDAAGYLIVEWIQPRPGVHDYQSTGLDNFVEKVIFDHNNYLFIHLRRDLSMQNLLLRQPPRIEYLNLHEDLWHVRKADMLRQLPPTKTSSYRPHHKAILSFAYCLPKQDYTISELSCASSHGRSTDKAGWTWKSEGRLSIAAPFWGLHAQAALSIFECEEGPTMGPVTCCAMGSGSSEIMVAGEDWFQSETSASPGARRSTDPEIISMRPLSPTMNLPSAIYYDDSTKSLRLKVSERRLPPNCQALLTLEGRLAFEYTTTDEAGDISKHRTFSVPGVVPFDRNLVQRNLYEEQLQGTITQGPL